MAPNPLTHTIPVGISLKTNRWTIEIIFSYLAIEGVNILLIIPRINPRVIWYITLGDGRPPPFPLSINLFIPLYR